jgi:3-hydroxy acid dehydrogenase/malonic semialdehyde reductase
MKNRKVVFISGATSGIGKSCAFIFAKNSFDVIITGRRHDRLKELKKDLEQQFDTKVLPLCFDVRNLEETRMAIASIDKNAFSTIDVLVNNAGLASGLSSIDEGNYDDWNVMIDTNVKGLLHVSREILPLMKAQGFGHIINVSSTAAKDAYPNGNVYCATKHAVDALSKSMRIDLLQYGIKVTSINPGACETEFSLVRFKGDASRANKVYEGFTPLTPDDVAESIFFSASLPKHVCINDLTITCLTQANAHYNIKKII